MRHAEPNLHHAVGSGLAVNVQPRLVRVEVHDGHDVELNDAGGDVGNRADAGHTVQREKAVEEGEAFTVGGVDQRAVARQRAIHAEPVNFRLPAGCLEGRAVEHEAALGSEHHFVKGEDIDGAVGLPGDLVRNAFGQSVHVLAERVDGSEHSWVEDIAQDQQVGRFAFVSKPLGEFVHANGEVRTLVEEIFHGKVSLELGHPVGGGDRQEKSDACDEEGVAALTRAVGEVSQPVWVDQGLHLLLLPFRRSCIEPIVHADPNQRRPNTGEEESGEDTERRFNAEGTQRSDVAEQVGGKRRNGRQGRQGDGAADSGERDASSLV